MRCAYPGTNRGFTAVELAAAVAAGVVVCAFLLLIGGNHRRLARLGDDIAHLKSLGVATAQYQADNADLFWTFSWRAHHSYQTLYPELNNAADDLTAAANQAVYLIRTIGGNPQAPPATGRIPHISYSHFVLAAYSAQPLPWFQTISSEDRIRASWATDPTCPRGCEGCPFPGDSTGFTRLGASFIPGVAFYDLSPVGARINQASEWNFYFSYGSATHLAATTLTGVSFPSSKVLLSDLIARHFGPRTPYCTHTEARLPLLMVDGSAPVRAAADANPGWQPNHPENGMPSSYLYSSNFCSFPPSLDPSGDTVLGRFRWTRGGIAGRDFGGPETP